MWKRIGLFILGLGLLFFCACGDSFAADGNVRCILPNDNTVSLTQDQCQTLNGVVDDQPASAPATTPSIPQASTIAPSGAVPESVYATAPPLVSAPVGLYQVRCWQGSLFGGYWRYVTLPYVPRQNILCPEPGFAYSYAPAPYGYSVPYGGGVSLRIHIGGGHHRHW